MSQLRLGKALAGLVEKGCVALVERNREGTLYRVAVPASAPAPQKPARGIEASAPVPSTASVGELARWFLEERKERGLSADEIVEEILACVEEGRALADIRAAL